MPHKMLLSALFLLLSGCAVYGGGYDRGYHNGHGYRYHDAYRRDYYPTPRYYYDDRRPRYYHPAPPRHVPAPPPPSYHYGHQQHHRVDDKRHQQPRHDYRRDPQRQEHRGGKVQQRGWDTGRSTQLRFSNGRQHNDQRRSGKNPR
jgi:hypothetical protein